MVGMEQGRLRPLPSRMGRTAFSRVYGKPLESAVDPLMQRYTGARLVRWLAERPSAWAGWPTFVATDEAEVAERTRRLRAAGWPAAVKLGTPELRQVDIAVAHLRARRRLALVGMLAKMGGAD